jgi:hypothetical protein
VTNGINNRKEMREFYRSLRDVDIPSYYKVGAITRGCAVLKSRAKSARRGAAAKHWKPLRPMVCITGGFFITVKGRLFVSLGHEVYEDIQLSQYVQARLSDTGLVKIRSLMITPSSVSFCYSKEVEQIPVRTVYGVDRNEKNLTLGESETSTQRALRRLSK